MKLLCYTRKELDDAIYAKRLAYAMHLALYVNERWTPLHHNEAVLFARATSNPDGTLTAKSLKNPQIIRNADGTFLILAIRTQADGEEDPDSPGCILLFSTTDLVHYTELGLLRLTASGFLNSLHVKTETSDLKLYWELTDGRHEYCNCKTNELSAGKDLSDRCTPCEETMSPELGAIDIEGAVVGNSLEITDEESAYLIKKLTVPFCTGMKLSKPGPVPASSLPSIRAVASYSDGTTVERVIDWTVTDEKALGIVHQEDFPAPFVENRADPVCMYRNGRYYFIATNDADGNNSLYMRCADTLSGIMDAPEHLFLDTTMYEGIGGLLWAPEFHEIAGKLYVFHAATSGEFFHEESRVRELTGENLLDCHHWSAPKMVEKPDGSPICEEGQVISLDMTTFEEQGKVYAVWSQRQFLPVDQGAWLWIAEIDPESPWKMRTEPVCICKPEYGWENNHTFVVEGPFALRHKKNLYLTYSGAGIDSTYTVGMLTLKPGCDPLSAQSWKKNNYPLMSSRSCLGEYGPGHNAYLTDEHGLTWNFYHMHPGLDKPRSSAMRRVHFDIDGEPMLDVLRSQDLPESFIHVEISLANDDTLKSSN